MVFKLFYFIVNLCHFFKIPIRLVSASSIYIITFFCFYNAAKRGNVSEQAIKRVALFLFIPALILLYQSFFERAEEYGSFMERADNVGYTLLSIMMLFSILKLTKINFILITVAFFATLLSMKRGAMITGTVFLKPLYLITESMH